MNCMPAMTTHILRRKYVSLRGALHLLTIAALTSGVIFLGGCTDNVNPQEPTQGSPGDNPKQDDPTSDDDAGASSSDAGDAGTSTKDAGPSVQCVSNFGGDELVTGFGRIDGTLVGIARPQDRSCAQSNATHVAIEIEMHGQNYVMQVNVQSDSGSPDVFFAEKKMAMPGDAWSEGWHGTDTLSYQDDLGAHSEDFTSYDNATLTQKIVDRLTIGKKISVYATAYGPNGGHDVHKEYGYTTDGAIVIDPESAAAEVLMFRFDDSPQF